jgi:hypothetical protein
MADELSRAREVRDKEKKEKKARELPKNFARMEPDDVISMIDEALEENERIINEISGV